jgi:hypothetical protein
MPYTQQLFGDIGCSGLESTATAATVVVVVIVVAIGNTIGSRNRKLINIAGIGCSRNTRSGCYWG